MSGPAGTLQATEAAFREMLARNTARLRRIASAYAGDSGEADDLWQEILLQIWRSLPRFRGESAMSTWVYRVALNTALSYRRAAVRRRRHEVTAAPPDPAVSSGDPRSQASLLTDFLASLAPIDRTIVVLYLDNVSNAEAAEILGMSTGAVAVRLHRIKQAFRDRYLEG